MPPSPPKATLTSITDTGLLTISFSETMQALDMEEVEHIIKNTVTAIGEQVFDLKVIIGVYSDPNKIDYTWSVVRYIGRSL